MRTGSRVHQQMLHLVVLCIACVGQFLTSRFAELNAQWFPLLVVFLAGGQLVEFNCTEARPHRKEDIVILSMPFRLFFIYVLALAVLGFLLSGELFVIRKDNADIVHAFQYALCFSWVAGLIDWYFISGRTFDEPSPFR